MKENIQVTITVDDVNSYATLDRSCLTGITACLRACMKKTVTPDERKEIQEKLDQLKSIKKWASMMYDKRVEQRLAQQ